MVCTYPREHACTSMISPVRALSAARATEATKKTSRDESHGRRNGTRNSYRWRRTRDNLISSPPSPIPPPPAARSIFISTMSLEARPRAHWIEFYPAWTYAPPLPPTPSLPRSWVLNRHPPPTRVAPYLGRVRVKRRRACNPSQNPSPAPRCQLYKIFSIVSTIVTSYIVQRHYIITIVYS